MKVVNEFKTVGNTRFDEEKTKELIQSLKDSGLDVGIENLSNYLKTQGVIVGVHVGGGNIDIELSPKAYGIDEEKLNEQSQKTIKNHVKNAKISFLPRKKTCSTMNDDYAKRLDALESRVRMQKSRMSMGYNNSFMTLDVFDEFKKSFIKAKEEYEDLREEILSNYDRLVHDFKKNVRETLISLNAIDISTEYNKIVSRFGEIGTAHYDAFRDKYAAGFYFEMSLKAFPVAESLDFFDPEIKRNIEDGINQDSVTAMYEIIGNALAEAFKAGGLVLLGAQDKLEVSKRTTTSLTQAAKRLRSKNIFANETIKDLAEKLVEISKSESFDFQIETAELVCVKAWKYANELGVGNSIVIKDSPLSEEELGELSEYVS